MSTTPLHIRQLCVQAQNPLTDSKSLRPTTSPSLDREVIADWCEEAGLHGYATYLRPRPAGAPVGPDVWRGMRMNILRWLAAEDPRMEIPPHVPVPRRAQRQGEGKP